MTPLGWASPGALGWTLAWRYCRRRSIAWLALVGAVLAVTIGFVPAPVMDGFIALMRENLRATAADVTVDILEVGDTAAARADVLERLRRVPGVVAVAPRADGLVGLTTLDHRQPIAGAHVVGIDLAAESQVTPVRTFLLAEYTDRDQPFALSAPVRDFDLRWRRACLDAAAAASGDALAARVDAAATAALEAIYGAGESDLAEPEEWAEERQAAWMRLGETELVKLPFPARMAAVAAARPATPAPLWDAAAAAAALDAEWARAAQAHREAARGADLAPGIVVGEELMRRWPRIRPGARIDLYTANLDAPTVDGSTRVRPSNRAFIVTGVFRSDFFEWDEKWCYADYDAARSFLVGSRIADTWVLRAADAEAAEALAAEARRAVLDCVPVPPEFRGPPEAWQNARVSVRTWQSGKKTFLKAVASQKGLLLGILALGIVIAGAGIAVTLWVLVSEKTRDIGILAAMGAGPATLVRVFVGTGVLLGFLGGVLGVAVGSLVLANADAIVRMAAAVGFDAIDAYVRDVQHLSAIPVIWRPASALGIVFWMCVAAGVFSIVPALRAASLDPVRAIRRG